PRYAGPPVRLAVVGCGAVTEIYHLPALARLGVRPEVLVDADLDRARAMAATCGAGRVGRSHEAVIGAADAAIVAVPIGAHAEVATALLAGGVHVLCEKPLAATAEEAATIVAAAGEHSRTLAIGLMRRFVGLNRWLKAALDAGSFGPVASFEHREGYRFQWPITSTRFFNPANGILADLGSHAIDLALWFFGAPDRIDYRDTAYGGTETDCLLEARFGPAGVPGRIELSRGRQLNGHLTVVTERATIELDHFAAWARVTPRPGAEAAAGGARPRRRRQEGIDLFTEQHADFLTAVATGGAPSGATPAEALAGLEVVLACYRQRRRWDLPWVPAAGALPAP
ncbi:MAG: Gfo/Idh/MocA family protein, partial [Acidimicrobiales bacterium]